LASAITFAIEAIALADAKFPVWFPYYGTWFFGIVAEITLVVMSKVAHGHPATAYQVVSTLLQVLRIFFFLILPILYFGLRNDSKKYDNSDAERQSLLSKKLAADASSSGDSTATSNGYGTTSETATEDVSDVESEDSWIEEERKAKEKISERLKQDGNWFTYAKGFTVRIETNLIRLQMLIVTDLLSICVASS
jgi:hypothetical protein